MAAFASLPDSQEDQEVFLRSQNADNFIGAAQRCLQEQDGRRIPVVTTLGAFHKEPEVLYVALEYAVHMGVEVRFVDSGDPRDATGVPGPTNSPA